MENNSIELNNSKAFNATMDKINTYDLLGNPRLIKKLRVELGDNVVPVFIGTNEKFETSYFTDATDKMIFQRVIGLAMKYGISYHKSNGKDVFDPIAIPIADLIGEIRKRDVSANELTSVDEIVERLYALRHIDILVEKHNKIVDGNNTTLEEIHKSCKPLLNVDYETQEIENKYNKKKHTKGFIILRDFPDLWFATEQSENEILYFPKSLFDFKTITDKTGDLKYIPARENMFYQMLKENIVLEIQNRKYHLKEHGLIKPTKTGFYKIPVEKAGANVWEKDRRINFNNFLCSLGVLDQNGELSGRYANRNKDKTLKSIKRDIVSILAALKEKGFIDDYYEYKIKNDNGTRVFAGWVLDPSVDFDDYYKNGSKIIDA